MASSSVVDFSHVRLSCMLSRKISPENCKGYFRNSGYEWRSEWSSNFESYNAELQNYLLLLWMTSYIIVKLLKYANVNHIAHLFVHFFSECGLDLLIRVFNVFTLTKCETCNTIHHKKNHYFLFVKKNMYRKMSSVHGSSVLTVIPIWLFAFLLWQRYCN